MMQKCPATPQSTSKMVKSSNTYLDFELSFNRVCTHSFEIAESEAEYPDLSSFNAFDLVWEAYEIFLIVMEMRL